MSRVLGWWVLEGGTAGIAPEGQGTGKVKVIQSCPTLCDPMDSTVHGILQARMLEWVAFPSPGDLPNSGIELRSPALQVDSLPNELSGKPPEYQLTVCQPNISVWGTEDTYHRVRSKLLSVTSPTSPK